MPPLLTTAGEIGRCAMAPGACRTVPSSVHMNPVLLKPQSDVGSQIVVQGKVAGQAKGGTTRLSSQGPRLVMESFEQVSAGADLVIVEGAGSPAEINLRAGDIANMGLPPGLTYPSFSSAISTGGVIASLVGTHAILPENDRRMVTGLPHQQVSAAMYALRRRHRIGPPVYRLALLRRRALAEKWPGGCLPKTPSFSRG